MKQMSILNAGVRVAGFLMLQTAGEKVRQIVWRQYPENSIPGLVCECMYGLDQFK
jgi:hypothetical protein